MAGMIEVAQATVTIIPTMQGAQAQITKDLTGAATPAGETAGKKAGESLTSSMASTMSKAGSTLTKGLTVPIAAIGVASFAAFKEVDNGLDIITSKTGASGEALEGMRDIMENLATSIPTDFETAGSAIGEVNTRFGLTGQALEDLSRQFLQFAYINDTDVSTSVDNVSKVLAAFGLDAKDAGTMLDALNTVGQQTGVDISTLSNQLSQNAAQFQQMGMSADEAASFLGQCDMAGLETSTMLMGLKTAMKNAASDGRSLDDFLSDFAETMNSNASESDKLAAAYEAFGTRAGGAIYNAVTNGKVDLENFTSSLGDFEGSVNDTFNSMVDPSEEFVEVINQLKILGADIAEAVMPAIKDIVEIAVPVIKDLVDGWNSLSPGMQEFIVKGALVAATVGPIISAGSKLITSISTIKNAFTSLTTTMSTVSANFGGFTGLMGTNISDLTTTMTGKLGVAGAAVGTFMAAFSITDWLLELTGAKAELEQFGSDLYDFFNQEQINASSLTDTAMANFEAYAMRGEGTYEQVLADLTAAYNAASSVNDDVSRTNAAALQTYIDMMESGVAEARATEAQARQLANESILSESQMTADTLQATMDLAQGYIETGSGNLETIMANLQTAYDTYSTQTDAASQETANSIQAMMDTLSSAASVYSEEITYTAETAAENLQAAMDAANSYLETGKGNTEAILNNLQAAYEFYAAQTDASSQATAESINMMMETMKTASSTSIDATNVMSEETIADLATISQALSDLGITDIGAFAEAVSTGMASVQSDVETAFTAMATSINENMETALSDVQSSIADMEAAFQNAELKFNQHIALPHFSMSGNFDAEKGTVPKVNVSWYKKAAEQGALFAAPTIIGVGDASQPEMLIGERTLYEQIAEAMREAGGDGGDIIIPVYLGNESVDTVVVKAIQRNNYRSGGR